MPALLELLNELRSQIQNRPRLLNFRNQAAAAPAKEETAWGSNRETAEEPFLTFKDNGGASYPISHPEFEYVTSPADYHQAILEQEIQKSQSYLAQKTAEMSVNKVSNQVSSEPTRADMSPAVLPLNIYYRDLIFR